ncbi:elongation of very long chain fatty acids protein AAEL008004, partial [Caerostris extrusa]
MPESTAREASNDLKHVSAMSSIETRIHSETSNLNLIPEWQTYPLMDNPSVAYALIAAYLVWVKFIGPTWMKDKPPYEFRMVMIVYNLFISALNAWIFYNFGMYGWFGRYRLRCEPIDFSNNEDALMMVYVCWIYFASKYIEFADTIFAVLRKKTHKFQNFTYFIIALLLPRF